MVVVENDDDDKGDFHGNGRFKACTAAIAMGNHGPSGIATAMGMVMTTRRCC